MKYLLFPIVFAFLCLETSYAGESENIATAKAMIDAINGRDINKLDAVVAPNVVRESAATSGVTVTSLDDFKAFLKADFMAVPDSVMTIDVIFANDEYVALRAIYSGTQEGPMGPFPATGKHFELPFIGILKLEQGKITRMWVEWDNVYALTQMGHFDQPVEPCD